MTRILLVLVHLLLLSSTAHAERIVLIGDSQLGGLKEALRAFLEADRHQVRVVYRNGWSEGTYVSRGRLEERAEGAETAVVFLGGNNYLRDSWQYLHRLEMVVGSLRAAGVQNIIWFGPAFSRDERVQDRKMYTEQMQSYFLPHLRVRWYSSFRDTEDLTFRDRVHFVRASYAVWARRAHYLISQNL